MKALLRILRPDLAASDDHALLGHVPVCPDQTDDPEKDPEARRAAALARAAQRYGKPWKCGPMNMRREVIVEPGEEAVVLPPMTETVRDAVVAHMRRALRGRKA